MGCGQFIRNSFVAFELDRLQPFVCRQEQDEELMTYEAARIDSPTTTP